MKTILAFFLSVALWANAANATTGYPVSLFNSGGNINPSMDQAVVVRAVSSSTSNTIGTGAQTFTVVAGLGFVTGQQVRVGETSNTANSMQGTVTSYSGTSLVLAISTTTGSGTISDWTIYGDFQTTPTNGTVTTASVVTAHGLSGTVANAGTTPAITLSTSVNGICKGNGTSFSTATGDTDYQNPISLTTTGTSGAATFSGDVLNIPTYNTGITRSISTITTNTSAGSTANTDYVYFCNPSGGATITITLPTAVSNTNQYTVENVGTGLCNVVTTSAQTIAGQASLPITANGTSFDILSNNSNWNLP